jgi:hypothetical protein
MSIISLKETYSEFERRRILSILGDTKFLLEMVSAKLYTSGKDGSSWLYSDIEGFLCYVIDFAEKCILFIIFDFFTLEKIFQFELYDDFCTYYTVLWKNFHCFETNNGFIGLKFSDFIESSNFILRVKKLDKNAIAQLFKKPLINRRKDIYKKGIEYITEIKQNLLNTKLFSVKSNISDMDDGIEIRKPCYYEIVNNISYDPKNKGFALNNMSQDIKNLFKMVGVKKKDFKNEALALSIFKNIVMIYDTLKKEKMEKTQKLLKRNTKVYADKLEIVPVKIAEPIVPTTSNIPKVPMIPKSPIPAVPKMPPLKNTGGVQKINVQENSKDLNHITDLNKLEIKPALLESMNSGTSASTTGNSNARESDCSNLTSSFLDEITRGVQLKKILPNKEEEKRPNKINKEDKNFLQNALEIAIKQRREELTKNDVDEDGKSDSDWSD